MIVVVTTEHRRTFPDAHADQRETGGKLEDGLDEDGVLGRHWILGVCGPGKGVNTRQEG